MGLDQGFQFVGQMQAPGRLAAGEGGFVQVQGVRQVVDARQGGEAAPVVFQPADGNAAEADAVIALLAADQAGAVLEPPGRLIGEGDLQGAVHRLGPRPREEDVVQVAGQQHAQARRQFERQRMPQLEGRGVVQDLGLALDRLDDGLAGVAGVDAPQAGRAVQHRAAVGGEVVHVPGRGEQARLGLEGAVRREGHPERIEVVGGLAGAGGGHAFILRRGRRRLGPSRPT
ncbi:hypothetical protein D3C80_1059430 [compost metagenome]